MEKLQAFKTAAHEGGFVEMNESAERGVLWLKKRTPETARKTHQLMCIDSRTKNVPIFGRHFQGKSIRRRFAGSLHCKNGSSRDRRQLRNDEGPTPERCRDIARRRSFG